MLVRPCSPQVPGLCAAGIRHHACDGCAQRRCAAPARRRPCHACLPSSPRPPERHSCAATHPPVCPPVARSAHHADTTPSVFAWQRRPSRWARRRSPRRSPSRSRCVVSASLCHPTAQHRDPHPWITKLSPPLCTTATPGAERRQRAVLPRGREGLHRRPQRLRLQDRPLELEPIPRVRRVSYPLHDCAALAPYPAPLPLSLAHDHP